jgi:hypothetical protein
MEAAMNINENSTAKNVAANFHPVATAEEVAALLAAHAACGPLQTSTGVHWANRCDTCNGDVPVDVTVVTCVTADHQSSFCPDWNGTPRPDLAELGSI